MSIIIQMQNGACEKCGRAVSFMDGKFYETNGSYHKCEDSEQDIEVRRMILKHLLALDKDLEKFCQTTHGSFGVKTIEGVCEMLIRNFKKTGSFSISELSQRISGLVKETI